MDLVTRVENGELDPVLLLTGDDHVTRERVLTSLRAQAVPETLRSFNYDAMDASTAGPDGILNAAETLPMMGKRRLVVVRQLHELAADQLAKLLPYLDAPNPSTTLVLLADKVNKSIKFYKTAAKKGVLHQIDVPKQPTGWIQAEARRRGMKMDSQAVRRLADVVGSDTGRLASSMEQLALFAGERNVTADDVDNLVAETRERTVFELVDAVGEGNRARALTAIARLFAQRESSIGLVVMLARHFRQLALFCELVAGRTPRRELPKLIGVPPFVLDKLAAQTRAYPAEAARQALVILSTADRDLKSPRKSILGERVLLESVVEELFALARR